MIGKSFKNDLGFRHLLNYFGYAIFGAFINISIPVPNSPLVGRFL